MNKSILQFLLFTGLLYVTACSSSDSTTKELEETFPEKSPEEHKSSIEQVGLDYVDQMENLRNSESVVTVINLIDLINLSDPFDTDSEKVVKEDRGVAAFRFLHDIKAFKNKQLTLKELANARTKEEEQSIQEAFDEIKGTYSWISSQEEWNVVEGGNKVIFQFPSEEGDTINNTVFTIHNYSGTTIEGNPLAENEEYSGDLPTALLADLTVDSEKVMEYSFNIAYNAKGAPTSVETSLLLSPFTLALNMSNTDAEITNGYSLKENGNNIIAVNMSVQGDFDVDNVEASADSEDISGIVTSGGATVQIFDVQFITSLRDVASLETKIRDIEDDEESGNMDDAAAKLEEAMNENIDFKVKYSSTNEVIALGIAEAVVMDETYYYYEWDESTQEYYEYEGTDTWIEPMLILEFGDGSKVSIETYVEEGFDDLITAIDDLIESIDDSEDEKEVLEDF